MLITKFTAALVAGAALFGAAGSARAAITAPLAGAFTKVGNAAPAGQPGSGGALVIDLAGTPSTDALNDALNVRWELDVLPGALVDAVAYQLTLATFGQSWLSEASVRVTNSAGDGITLRPGFSTDDAGQASFSGSASLLALNMAFNAGSDGKLNFQFFEDYDDVAGSADAVFGSGSITLGGVAVTPVPEPASYGLMMLGLLGVAAAARRNG